MIPSKIDHLLYPLYHTPQWLLIVACIRFNYTPVTSYMTIYPDLWVPRGKDYVLPYSHHWSNQDMNEPNKALYKKHILFSPPSCKMDITISFPAKYKTKCALPCFGRRKPKVCQSSIVDITIIILEISYVPSIVLALQRNIFICSSQEP